MKRKIKLNIKRVSPGQTYAILCALCLVFSVMYLGFFAATMSYASERENARDDIALISTDISEAELSLLARSQSLTEATAREQGFVLATAKHYVSEAALTYHAPDANLAR